jgi:hypothetical protein
MFEVEDKSYSGKDGKKAAEEWVKAYKEKMELNYRVSNAEKAMLKKLIIEFGLTDLIKVINYYIINYENIKYINGAPSINAMMGFRRTLFPEALKTEKVIFKIDEGGEENGERKICW